MRLLTVVFAGVCLASAGTVVSPPGYASVEGNLGSNIPFGHTELTMEQAYAATLFGSAPVFITGIAFRPDSNYGFAFTRSLENLEVELSTTSAEPGLLASAFDANFGADRTVVLNRASYTVGSSKTGSPGGPYDFDIVLTFDTPFLYNPALGNLLFYFRVGTGAPDRSAGTNVDSENNGAGVKNGSIYAFSSTAAEGENANTEVITQFLTSPTSPGDPSPVPEPGTLAVAGTTLAAILAAKFGRKR